MEILELAQKRKAEAAELYEARTEALGVVFHGGEVEKVGSEAIVGRALRVILGGKLGFASTAGGAPEALLEAALGAAQHGDPAPFRFPTLRNGTKVEAFDPAVPKISAEELLTWGEEAVRAIRAEFPELVVNVYLSRTTTEVVIRNTAGGERREKRTGISLTVGVERVREGDIWLIYETQAVRRLVDLDRKGLVEKLLQKLHWGVEVVPPPVGKPPVLFLPSAVPVLVLPLTHGLSGLSVFLGTSPLKGRLGEQAFHKEFNLVDDGLIPFGPRSRSFDDEGLPVGRLPLVEDGVVQSFFYDLRAAALNGVESTGNGLKGGPFGDGGFRAPPGPAPRHLLIRPGEGSLEALMRDMKEGLVVSDVIGLGQGNIQSGAFSNNVSVGFVVRNGKVVGRVKNTMIFGNAYEVLKNGLIQIGGEPEWVGGSLYTPPLLVEGVSVVGR
ncbi:MAG: TldD/PmbA family protein [Candidatus Bipolaricaulota bacterium]|nr:TldD/PmbA family protein [Candidatus Bipolaricaulota bacterium]MDW8126588.1 TldD/PmbA family protein [Candidatus Bipolaricaulota bacterium]